MPSPMMALLDPARPASIVEIAADGSTHTFLDLGVVLGAAFSADPTAAAAIDQTSVDMWQVGDSFIIDSRKYQALVDFNPTADLGPFAPGIGVVDLYDSATSGPRNWCKR